MTVNKLWCLSVFIDKYARKHIVCVCCERHFFCSQLNRCSRSEWFRFTNMTELAANPTHTVSYSALYGYNQPAWTACGVFEKYRALTHNHSKLCPLDHMKNSTWRWYWKCTHVHCFLSFCKKILYYCTHSTKASPTSFEHANRGASPRNIFYDRMKVFVLQGCALVAFLSATTNSSYSANSNLIRGACFWCELWNKAYGQCLISRAFSEKAIADLTTCNQKAKGSAQILLFQLTPRLTLVFKWGHCIL